MSHNEVTRRPFTSLAGTLNELQPRELIPGFCLAQVICYRTAHVRRSSHSDSISSLAVDVGLIPSVFEQLHHVQRQSRFAKLELQFEFLTEPRRCLPQVSRRESNR